MSNPPVPPPFPPNQQPQQGPHPPTTNAALLQILAQQQQLMTELAAQVKGMSRDEVVLDSLSSNIAEFAYDPEHGCTFDSWYARYADLFDKDAGKLDDAAKIRLLMRKLNPAAHERFTSFILPKTPKDFKEFSVVVTKLKTIFGTPVSVFNRRFHCLQITKDDAEDFVSYSCRVNRACVDFKISELSEEQFKTLIFVCGLKSPRESDIRMRLITKLNERAEVTLEQVVEDCKKLVNLKKDTNLVEKQEARENGLWSTP